MHFSIQTDHKPLVPLLSTKCLDEMPIRVQRFRLRLMRYSYSIVHVPGKELCTADTLSRAPVTNPSEDDSLKPAVEAFVSMVISSIPATTTRLEEISAEQKKDETCKTVRKFCEEGWPDNSVLKGQLKAFSQVKSELSVNKGLLLRGRRLIITSLRKKLQVVIGEVALTTAYTILARMAEGKDPVRPDWTWEGLERPFINLFGKS